MSNWQKAENKILQARIPVQEHTDPKNRKRLLKLGDARGRHPLMLLNWDGIELTPEIAMTMLWVSSQKQFRHE